VLGFGLCLSVSLGVCPSTRLGVSSGDKVKV
jgi:hypothetical protein